MIERLVNQSAVATLERAAGFHARRHAVLADNLANVSTPGFRQKDVSFDDFRRHMRRQLDAGNNPTSVAEASQAGSRGIVFHDGGDRSVEQLLGEQAANALRHNLNVELLRKHFASMHLAVRERVA